MCEKCSWCLLQILVHCLKYINTCVFSLLEVQIWVRVCVVPESSPEILWPLWGDTLTCDHQSGTQSLCQSRISRSCSVSGSFWDIGRCWKQLIVFIKGIRNDPLFLGYAFLWFVVDADTSYAVSLESVLAGHENWVYAVHWQPSFSKGKKISNTYQQC